MNKKNRTRIVSVVFCFLSCVASLVGMEGKLPEPFFCERPPEILQEVLSYLNPQQQMAARLVNKEFNQVLGFVFLSQPRLIWVSSEMLDIKDEISFDRFLDRLETCGFAFILEYTSVPLSDDHLKKIYDRVEASDELKMNFKGFLLSFEGTSKGLQWLPPSLRTLKFYGFNFECCSLEHLAQLEELSIADWEGVLRKFSGPKSLKKLFLSCYFGGLEKESFFGLRKLKKLEKLTLRGSKITDEILDTILPALSNLKVLRIEGCNSIGKKGFVNLRSLPSLECLQLYFFKGGMHSGRAQIVWFADLPQLLPNLKKLKFYIWKNGGGKRAIPGLSFLKDLKQLEEVSFAYSDLDEEAFEDISQCINLKVVCVKNSCCVSMGLILLQNLSCLEVLRLRKFFVNAEALVALAKNVQSLKRLDLSECSVFSQTGDSIGRCFQDETLCLLKDFSNLEEVALSGCSGTYNSGMARKGMLRKVLQNLPISLKVLKLDELQNNTDKELLPLEWLENLEELTLKSCRVGNEELAVIVSLRKLKKLELPLFGIDVKELSSILKKAQNLEEVVFEDFWFITPALVESLLCLPNLRKVCLEQLRKPRRDQFLPIIQKLRERGVKVSY